MKEAFEKALRKKLKEQGVSDEWADKHLEVMTIDSGMFATTKKKKKKNGK